MRIFAATADRISHAQYCAQVSCCAHQKRGSGAHTPASRRCSWLAYGGTWIECDRRHGLEPLQAVAEGFALRLGPPGGRPSDTSMKMRSASCWSGCAYGNCGQWRSSRAEWLASSQPAGVAEAVGASSPMMTWSTKILLALLIRAVRQMSWRRGGSPGGRLCGR